MVYHKQYFLFSPQGQEVNMKISNPYHLGHCCLTHCNTLQEVNTTSSRAFSLRRSVAGLHQSESLDLRRSLRTTGSFQQKVCGYFIHQRLHPHLATVEHKKSFRSKFFSLFSISNCFKKLKGKHWKDNSVLKLEMPTRQQG